MITDKNVSNKLNLSNRTLFLLMFLWNSSVFAKLPDASQTVNGTVSGANYSVTDERLSEMATDGNAVAMTIVLSRQDLDNTFAYFDEEQSDVVYVDESGDEYTIISEETAHEGGAGVRLKKKGKGRNCNVQDGGASWYGPGFHGNRTANGERFNQNELTAAHKTIRFNSLVRVTYNGQSTVVRINDAGPYAGGRVIDLSKAAAEDIGLIAAGHGQVELEIVRCGA